MKDIKYLIFVLIFIFRTVLSQGSVIFLTGTSSSGKTSILNEFKRMAVDYECLSCDEFVHEAFLKLASVCLGCKENFENINKKLNEIENGQNIRSDLECLAEVQGFDNFVIKILELVDQDKRVVCETVLPSQKEQLTFLFNSLLDIRTFFVLVYCPLDCFKEFVESRNKRALEGKSFDETFGWRDLNDVVAQFCEYYKIFDKECEKYKSCIGDIELSKVENFNLILKPKIYKSFCEYFKLKNYMDCYGIIPVLCYDLIINIKGKTSLQCAMEVLSSSGYENFAVRMNWLNFNCPNIFNQ
ncbi:MAG: hypothetical protein ABIA74_02500 [bacterium]